jgi:hypothetical protein
MKLTAEEQAKKMWQIQNYYWNVPELEAKQAVVLNISGIIRALQIYNIDDVEYWNEVKIEVYNLKP